MRTSCQTIIANYGGVDVNVAGGSLHRHPVEEFPLEYWPAVIGSHTAVGDAIVTGEMFKMIPLLAEQGIRTLREAREAAERTYYARVKY